MVEYTEHTLDITADDKIFTPSGVGALNIGVVQCLSELIANSLDWRRFNKEEIKRIRKELQEENGDNETFLETYGHLLDAEPVETVVRIQYNGDSIEIRDNGIGMTLEELEVGLKLRGASDSKRAPLRSRKGMFGMGMKIGILGTGWRFAIRTRSLLESTENSIEIDTRQIDSGELKLRKITGRVYKAHDNSGPLDVLESGTYIRIEDLHKKRHKPELWRHELGLNFSPEIRFEGVQIIIVDASHGEVNELLPCQPHVEDIIPDSKIDLDSIGLEVQPDYGDGTRGEPVKIRGWLGLRSKSAAGSGRWGLHTFRKGQLVEPYHNDGPKDSGLMPKEPHPMLARVHGEIHLDMCDPNFTKVGWNTELESWNDVREVLRPYLDALMKASSEYRVRAGGGAKSRKFIQKAKEMAKSAVTKLAQDEAGREMIAPSGSPQSYISIGDDKYLKISIAQQVLRNSNRFWEYSYRPGPQEIAIFVNTESSLWQWAGNSNDPSKLASLIVNWAIVDSLYFCLVDDIGIARSRAVDLRDRWHAKLYEVEEDE